MQPAGGGLVQFSCKYQMGPRGRICISSPPASLRLEARIQPEGDVLAGISLEVSRHSRHSPGVPGGGKGGTAKAELMRGNRLRLGAWGPRDRQGVRDESGRSCEGKDIE